MPIFSVIDTTSGADNFYEGRVKDAANWATLEALIPVGTTATQTLTNKTLTSPTLTTPIINCGSDATGDVYYRNGTTFTRLAKGTAGQFLKMNSGATLPEWGSVIPSGTKMLFYADTAPSGWTIDDTLDDKVVFITKGSAAAGQTGGGAHSTGTWTQPNHTHTGPSHTHTGPSHTHTGPSHTHTTGDFTLSATEIPAHVHTMGASGNTGIAATFVVGDTDASTKNTSSVGSGAAHNHGATAAGGTGATGADGTGATGAEGTGATGNGATANTWRPAAYCVIVCSKD
jgi:hypothetical protein